VEEDLWLCPIEDRRWGGFSLGSCLLLIDQTSRLCRPGKARNSREVASILDRLGTSAEVWGCSHSLAGASVCLPYNLVLAP
jgi:hypothetical protein